MQEPTTKLGWWPSDHHAQPAYMAGGGGWKCVDVCDGCVCAMIVGVVVQCVVWCRSGMSCVCVCNDRGCGGTMCGVVQEWGVMYVCVQ